MLLSSLVISSYTLNRLGYKFWYKRSYTMVWALRLWGVSSLAMLVTFLLPSMHSWAPAEAVRSSQFDFERLMQDSSSRLDPADYIVRIREPCSGVQTFQEAPAFRNGIQCLPQKGFKLDEVCDPTSVHIAMTLDKTYLRGSIAAVFSVVKHAICPENIIFHFLVSSNERELKNTVRTTFPYLRFKVYFFDEEIVRHRISSSVREDLEQPLNYARNYLADILEPCIQRVIYLDSDLVVVDDIGKLWGITLGPHTIGAPEYCHANFTKYFTDSFWSNKSLSSIFQGRKPCYYNTGVMVMDLARWRQEDYTRTIEKWMDIQKENKIYELGSLPPFLLVFGGLLEQIDHRWNQHGLGGDNRVGSCRALHPGPVSLLHWSGKGKPWLRIDSGNPCPLDSLWAPYDLFLHPFQDHSSS